MDESQQTSSTWHATQRRQPLSEITARVIDPRAPPLLQSLLLSCPDRSCSSASLQLDGTTSFSAVPGPCPHPGLHGQGRAAQPTGVDGHEAQIPQLGAGPKVGAPAAFAEMNRSLWQGMTVDGWAALEATDLCPVGSQPPSASPGGHGLGGNPQGARAGAALCSPFLQTPG